MPEVTKKTGSLQICRHSSSISSGNFFGSSSEKRNDLPGQLNLFSETVSEEEPAPELIEPEFIELNAGKKKRKPKAGYDEMFADLPVRHVEVDTLTEEQKHCPVCQSRMVPIDHAEIRTEIRYTWAKLEHVVYIATTYGCPICKETEDSQFIKDEGRPALVPGSYASSSLVSHIMYGKYADARPLYRQEKALNISVQHQPDYDGRLDHYLRTGLSAAGV